MGTGIAEVVSRADLPVLVADVNEDALENFPTEVGIFDG